MANKAVRELSRALARHGIGVELRRNGHYRTTGGSGGTVYFSGTASDHRARKNIERDIRRVHGVDLRNV